MSLHRSAITRDAESGLMVGDRPVGHFFHRRSNGYPSLPRREARLHKAYALRGKKHGDIIHR